MTLDTEQDEARRAELAARVVAMPADQRQLHFGFAMAVKTLETFQAKHSPDEAPNDQLDQLCAEWITATNRILDYCHVASHPHHP